MAETALQTVKKASGWSIALGILMILVGMLAILSPLVAGVFAVYIVAWTAIINGVVQLVYGFRTHVGGKMILEILLGLLYIAAGCLYPDPPCWRPAGANPRHRLLLADLRCIRLGAGVPASASHGLGMDIV